MLKTSTHHDVIRFDLARTLAGRGRYWTAAYLVDGLMVDTGCAFSALELVRALSDIPLIGVVNTHSHEDHIGANGYLQRQREGLEIRAHPLALPVLAEPRRKQPLHPYRRVMWGWPEPSQGTPISDGEMIETDNYSFQVVHTPGHSSDHICLYEPDTGWLFTGDLFVGGRERALRSDFDVWEILSSLKRISTLSITTLFPGSARVRENPAAELVAKISYLEDLGEQVLTRYRQGRSVNSIVRELCGSPMLLEFITLGHFSRRSLVLSFIERGL